MSKNEQINLHDLIVNTENYRFEPLASQKEAIDKMVEDQKEKLLVLAEHIVQYGLNPNDKIIVAPSHHDASKFVVLEGNRRVVTLLLLNNPDLLDLPGYISLKSKFKKLHDDRSTQIIDVPCLVYDDPAEADVWIKLKHAGQSEGAGTVRWDAQQVDRFEEKVEGKSSTAIQIINFLGTSQKVPKDIRDNAKSIKATNLERLISDRNVRNFLGIEKNNGVIQTDLEEAEVLKGLTKVARDLLNPEFKVKDIYLKEDRMDYINTFSSESTPDYSNRSKKPWRLNINKSAAPASEKSTTKNVVSTVRKHLIPKKCKLAINNSRLNKIYDELQSLTVDRYTNAVAISFRVFVELSLDVYIEHHKLTNSLSSTRSGQNLLQKVNTVADHMEKKKFADSAICKSIKVAAKNKNDLLGMDTLHAYVHNHRFTPKTNDLLSSWDDIQTFVENLWGSIQ